MACIGRGFLVRLAEPSDADLVTTMFLSQRLRLQDKYGLVNFHRIIEMSLFSFVAYDSNELVAFCSFNDVPSIPGDLTPRQLQEARVWAMQDASSLGILMDTSLWLEVCATRAMQNDQAMHVSKGFLRAIFSLCPELEAILHPSVAEYPVLPHLFEALSICGCYGLVTCACFRSTVLPIMKIRIAKEEDHDELLPVFERVKKRGSPLAQIPESANPSRQYAMARLIGAQNEDNTVFVAEVDGAIVGVMSITAAISRGYCFDFNVDAFDGLTKKEVKRFEMPLEETQKNESDGVSIDPAEGARPSMAGVAAELLNSSDNQAASLETSVVEADESQDLSSSEYKATDEPAPKFKVVEVEVPSGITNAFQISMFCLEEEYEHQALDFLYAAFQEEKRDYCLVGFPYTRGIPPLLHLFTRVPCRPSRRIMRDDVPENSMITDDRPDPKISNLCLYLLHRDSLQPGFEVRRTKAMDADELMEFLGNFKDRKIIADLVETPREGCFTVVGLLSGEIVGFAMIEESVPVEALCSHFSIKSLVDLSHYPVKNQGCITLFTISPIFRHRRRFFLREIMRLLDLPLLYCPIFPHQDLPDVIDDFFLVPPKQHVCMSTPRLWGRQLETLGPSRRASLRRLSTAGFSSRGLFDGFDCTLYLITHRFTSRFRVVVNSRILVAGASRTAEAFLHKLVAHRQFQFTNLNIISPSGFDGFSSFLLDAEPGPARKFTKLGIDCQVALKEAAVTDMDRKRKNVLLSNGDVVPYDLLILTIGLQDQTKYKLGLEEVNNVVKADDFLSKQDAILASLKELKVPREALPPGEGPVIVYGSTLEAFYMVQFLLCKGIKGCNIVLAHPEPKLTACCVFGDANVLSCLLEELSWNQVNVVSGIKLLSVTLDDAGNLKNAVFEDKRKDPKTTELDCCLLITCDKKQIDVPVFTALRREDITFDGRVIVDGNFQTNDSFIFSAGPVSKFSRGCGKLPNLEVFCSIEVGEALADSMVTKFHTHLPESGKLWPSSYPLPVPVAKQASWMVWPVPSTPVFLRPKCTGGIIPGGVRLFCIVLPLCHLKDWHSLQVQTLLSKFSNSYARLDILETHQAGRILYAGKMKAEAWKFQQLVGLPSSLLNNLPCRYYRGAVNNIVDYLSQAWSAVLFHCDFPAFYRTLALEVIQTGMKHLKGSQMSYVTFEKLDPELSCQISTLVKRAILRFMDDRRPEFPMYRLPRKATDVRLLLPKVMDRDEFQDQEEHKRKAAAAAAIAHAKLVEVSDIIKATFKRLLTTFGREEQLRDIRQAVAAMVQKMEAVKPVLLSLKGWGYVGVDKVVEEIDKRMVMIIRVQGGPSREDARTVLEEAVEAVSPNPAVVTLTGSGDIAERMNISVWDESTAPSREEVKVVMRTAIIDRISLDEQLTLAMEEMIDILEETLPSLMNQEHQPS